jgi:hypothetical protein
MTSVQGPRPRRSQIQASKASNCEPGGADGREDGDVGCGWFVLYGNTPVKRDSRFVVWYGPYGGSVCTVYGAGPGFGCLAVSITAKGAATLGQ